MAKAKKKSDAPKNKGGRPRTNPKVITPFGTWLDGQDLAMTDVAEDLEVALSTAYGIKNGSFTPSLQMAARIEEYTEGAVSMQDWE